jgi:CRP-like cAMP-binding protein
MYNEVEEAGRSLSGLKVFAGIPSALLTKIGNVCEWHRIDANDVIVDSASMRPHGIHFLVNGVIEVLRHDCGDQFVTVAELEAPECFDDLDLISGKAGCASIRARTDCVVAQMPGDRFHSFLRACPCISPDLLEKVVSISNILGEKAARPDLSDSSGYGDIQSQSLQRLSLPS